MTSKQEVAALMASDGDHEKKISLLKKAIVTVTKQKQEMEAAQQQLQEELRLSRDALAESRRENTTLQRRVQTLESQLEQARSSGSAFGQNMLKGLSSIMGSVDGSSGGERHGSQAKAKDGQLLLSPEDVNRLVKENEQLHMQVFTLKVKLEETQRGLQAETQRYQSELGQLQGELQDLRGLLEATTKACDDLNASCALQQAISDFCHGYFELALPSISTSPSASTAGRRPPPAAAAAEQDRFLLTWPPASGPSSVSTAVQPVDVPASIVQHLLSCCEVVKTLLTAVTVLAVTLREQLPRFHRSTVGDLRVITERLSRFIDAHSVKKDRMMYLLEQLEKALSSCDAMSDETDERCGTEEALSGEMPGVSTSFVKPLDIIEVQVDLIHLLIEWLALLRLHAPILIDSCVAYLPPDHSFSLRTIADAQALGSGMTAAYAQPVTDVVEVERSVFIEGVTRTASQTLASIQGSLMAVECFIAKSPYYCRSGASFVQPQNSTEACDDGSAAPPHHREAPTVLPDKRDVARLLGLQQFWLNGCNAVRLLHQSLPPLSAAIANVAEACNKSEVRDTLQYIGKQLQCIRAASVGSARATQCPVGGEEAWMRSAPDDAPRGKPLTCPGGYPLAAEDSAIGAASGVTDHLTALAAADRAAATYYTQMNHLYLALAEKEDQLFRTEEEMTTIRAQLQTDRYETALMQKALEEQIKLLSNQLTAQLSIT